LLDVSALLALLWARHVHNARAMAWQDKKKLVLLNCGGETNEFVFHKKWRQTIYT